MPWTISTDGFPLKKEIWSGSCLEGESGVALTSVWSLASSLVSPVDFRSSLPSSAPAVKHTVRLYHWPTAVKSQRVRTDPNLRWAGRSRSPCRSWHGCPGAGGGWPTAPDPICRPAWLWRRPALSLSSRPLTSLQLSKEQQQHKEILETLSEWVSECSLWHFILMHHGINTQSEDHDIQHHVSCFSGVCVIWLPLLDGYTFISIYHATICHFKNHNIYM